MKKEMILKKLIGSSLAGITCIVLAGSDVSSASMDMAGLMAEGIPYECAKVQKCIDVPNDKTANREALMAEGIVYENSVIEKDAVLIKLNHRQLVQQSREDCLCDGLAKSLVQR